jgi:hypothetical protein
MTSNQKIQPVRESELIDKVRQLAAVVVVGTGDVNRDWVMDKHWVVVPVESEDHFSGVAISRIEAGCRDVSGRCFALITEEVYNIDSCFVVPCEVEALEEINNALALFPFVLVPEDLSWCIVCSKEDYYLVAGPSMFVETALGMSISAAQEAYRKSASEWVLEKQKQFHLSVAARFEELTRAATERA